MTTSLWTDTVTLPSFPTLSQDQTTEILIIFAKLYQKRSYVIGLKGAKAESGSYVDYGKNARIVRKSIPGTVPATVPALPGTSPCLATLQRMICI